MTTNIITNIEETPVGELVTDMANAPAIIAEYFDYLNGKDEVSWREKSRVEFLRDDNIRNLTMLKKIGHYRTDAEIAEVDKIIEGYKSLVVRHNPEKPVFEIPMGIEYRGE